MTTWRAITNPYGNRHPGNKRYTDFTEIKRTLNEIRHIRGSYCFAMDPSRPGRWVKLYVDLATGHTMDADVTGPLYYTLAAGMDDGSLKYPDGTALSGLNFHHFDRLSWICAGIYMCGGAAFSRLRLKLADIVLM